MNTPVTRPLRADRRSAPLSAVAATLLLAGATLAQAQPTRILFVGNSYTFARLDPVLTYNAANVTDLTRPRGELFSGLPFTDPNGTNSYPVGTIIPGSNPPREYNSFSPHTQTITWGGVPGIFKQMTVQRGLNYEVSLSTRNAASLRGHFLNTANPANWDLRSNIASQAWDKVVLQDQSDEALGPRSVVNPANPGGPLSALPSNFPSVQAYVDRIEDWVHQGNALTYTEQAMFTAIHGSVAACQAAGGGNFCTNTTARNIPANPNANPLAKIYLQQTWARPNLINPPATSTPDPRTGDAIYSSTLAPSFFSSLEAMTTEMTAAMQTVANFAGADGSGGITGIVPVGQAFLAAVQAGLATRDMYAPGALSDGLIDLWFNDGTHASVHGSYLSALTLFGSITGEDPRSLGANEIAAADLGISPQDAVALQLVAAYSLGLVAAIPEPSTWALWLGGAAVLGWRLRRRAVGDTRVRN
jgi:hypothetical protein